MYSPKYCPPPIPRPFIPRRRSPLSTAIYMPRNLNVSPLRPDWIALSTDHTATTQETEQFAKALSTQQGMEGVA